MIKFEFKQDIWTNQNTIYSYRRPAPMMSNTVIDTDRTIDSNTGSLYPSMPLTTARGIDTDFGLIGTYSLTVGKDLY
jgi:hypothetical protein